MATLLTAILCLLLVLRNCRKRIKQEFLDTDSVQLKTFALATTYSKYSKILTSYSEKKKK